jgi:hypothetical protein
VQRHPRCCALCRDEQRLTETVKGGTGPTASTVFIPCRLDTLAEDEIQGDHRLQGTSQTTLARRSEAQNGTALDAREQLAGTGPPACRSPASAD